MKAEPQEQGKIHMGDIREACELDLPGYRSVDIPFTLSLRLLAETRAES